MTKTTTSAISILTNYTQAEEDALALVLSGKNSGSSVIYNITLSKSRIWNGTSFDNAPNLSTDGSAIKRQEKYNGQSDVNGVYTIIFASPFSVPPIVLPIMNNQDVTNAYMRLSDVSVNGFTINCYSINTTSILGIVTLGTAVTPLANVAMDVLVMEK